MHHTRLPPSRPPPGTGAARIAIALDPVGFHRCLGLTCCQFDRCELRTVNGCAAVWLRRQRLTSKHTTTVTILPNELRILHSDRVRYEEGRPLILTKATIEFPHGEIWFVPDKRRRVAR